MHPVLNDPTVQAAFKAQAERIATEQNDRRRTEFLGAAENWAKNYPYDKSLPKPIAPAAVRAIVGFGEPWTFDLEDMDVAVSTLDPASLIPPYGTDKNAVGGKVGGPIPNAPGLFYIASDATTYAGEPYTAPDGKKYLAVHENPWKRYWVRLG